MVRSCGLNSSRLPSLDQHRTYPAPEHGTLPRTRLPGCEMPHGQRIHQVVCTAWFSSLRICSLTSFGPAEESGWEHQNAAASPERYHITFISHPDSSLAAELSLHPSHATVAPISISWTLSVGCTVKPRSPNPQRFRRGVQLWRTLPTTINKEPPSPLQRPHHALQHPPLRRTTPPPLTPSSRIQ
jgi:hypothetical protein